MICALTKRSRVGFSVREWVSRASKDRTLIVIRGEWGCIDVGWRDADSMCAWKRVAFNTGHATAPYRAHRRARMRVWCMRCPGPSDPCACSRTHSVSQSPGCSNDWRIVCVTRPPA